MSGDGGHLAITVDVEFFDSAFLFRGRCEDPPDAVRDLGREGVWYVADLLERHDARGTFFVLGEIAERSPDLVAELRQRGHEVASHGYSKSHPDLRSCGDDRLAFEVERSREVLEEATGDRIAGFRAPAFSANDAVLERVADAGYAYDSSVVPCRRIPGFYGGEDHHSWDERASGSDDDRGVTELPIGVEPSVKLPLSGAWMRLLGRRYAEWGIRRHLRARPATVLYVHPWELVDLPRHDEIPRRVYWRTGEYTRETLRRIVAEHANRLAPMTDLRRLVDAPVTARSEGAA